MTKKGFRSKGNLEEIFRDLLIELRVNMKLGDLANTPERMARTWLELTRSYQEELPDIKTFKADKIQVLGVHGLHYFSLCEHHGLPFEGSVCIMYVPNDKLIGLSKPARIVDYYSHFLMIQERFTSQILKAVDKAIKPYGVYVISRGRHLCSAMRGIKSREHEFIVEEQRFMNEKSKLTWMPRLYKAEDRCGEVKR